MLQHEPVEGAGQETVALLGDTRSIVSHGSPAPGTASGPLQKPPSIT